MRLARFVVVLGALASSGCFTPKYGNGDLQCQAGAHPCPSGYHCAMNNTCWKNGSDPTLDMAGSTDDGGLPDMAQPPVLTYPPAAAWTSCGGGSVTAANGDQLNVSVCPSFVGGTAVSPNNATITFGFFSDDIY